ncbi:nucleotidyltransferase domain-containing protein [Acidisphaera sp. S103]|uniref:nucleotidyltransferase domain-containing protein n=1 Tax=Acidisphaera sp. S103 TaxID=1747223 RepID=UPI0020B136B7|nr:nucleotidyltransferase domain-containing protein [Acidisphaera sp. S103]
MLYRLRPDHPLSPALSTLFEAEERRFQSILDSIRVAAESAEPGLVALWVFGSVARGKDRADSDLDLALVAEPEVLPRLSDALRDALVAPAERLGFTPSLVTLGTDDVVRLAAQHDPWWTGVARDAIPLLDGSPDEVAVALRTAAGKEAAA